MSLVLQEQWIHTQGYTTHGRCNVYNGREIGLENRKAKCSLCAWSYAEGLALASSHFRVVHHLVNVYVHMSEVLFVIFLGFLLFHCQYFKHSGSGGIDKHTQWDFNGWNSAMNLMNKEVNSSTVLLANTFQNFIRAVSFQSCGYSKRNSLKKHT